MVPPISVAKIGTQMVCSLPGINILEMIHSIGEGFDTGRALIKLVPAENPVFGENPFLLWLSDDFLRLSKVDLHGSPSSLKQRDYSIEK